jgi:hypothetical protein
LGGYPNRIFSFGHITLYSCNHIIFLRCATT